MKRADLHVGMIVENKHGTSYVIVDTGGWRDWGSRRPDATGVTYGGIPILSTASPVPANGRVGVLAVQQHWMNRVQEGDPTAGSTLHGEAVLPRYLYPEGTYWANVKAKQAAMEARVEADEQRDRELVEMVQRYWGDVPHLIGSAGVILDDGPLTERERQVLVTLVLAGQNR